MKFVQEFREFAVKGNVMDLAVGVIIGGAFGKIVTSLVNDMIMPPIGALTNGLNFKSLFINLTGDKALTFKAAQEGGKPIIAYGAFLNTLLEFLIISIAVFLLVKLINQLRRDPPPAEATTRDCPFCCTEIPKSASRCGHCTSMVDPMTEPVAA